MKKCIRCNSIFTKKTNTSRNDFNKQKFCNISCFRKSLSENLFKKRGKNSIFWKGGIQYHKGYKYVYAPDHPYRARELYVGEHRLVVEEHIGRFIKKSEFVHHINGDRLDNRIENLYLCKDGKEHTAIHRQMDELMFELIKNGIVKFNEQEKRYYLVTIQ